MGDFWGISPRFPEKVGEFLRESPAVEASISMKGARTCFRMGKMFGLYVDHWEEWIRLPKDGIGYKAMRGEQPWYLCGKGRYIEQHVAFGVHAVEAVARFL